MAVFQTMREYRAMFPSVKFFLGRAFDVDAYHCGAMWGRVPLHELSEGCLVYRHSFRIVFDPRAVQSIRWGLSAVIRVRWK